jgi:hypothetical protein
MGEARSFSEYVVSQRGSLPNTEGPAAWTSLIIQDAFPWMGIGILVIAGLYVWNAEIAISTRTHIHSIPSSGS